MKNPLASIHFEGARAPKPRILPALCLLIVCSGIFGTAHRTSAQTATSETLMLNLPRQSQHAVVMQRIGITDITINYHRPLANGRKLWGKVVPYGRVWRAGANENTAITFTDPVTIENQPLARGTYGLHMIPGTNEWTVIFSTNSTSWGSFSYQEEEDALRVKVQPQACETHDALTYDFDEVRADSTVVTMRWGNLAVPFKVAVDVKELTTASIRQQLRGYAQYYPDGWDDAAGYFLANKIHLEEALQDEERSLQIDERFDNLLDKSKILEALGRTAEATACRDQALAKASAVQLYSYGRQLQGEKKSDEAFALYRANAKKFPDHWISHLGLARAFSAQSDFDDAVKEMKLALVGAPKANQPNLENALSRLQAKEDINR